MTIIRCPGCGESISNRAPRCSHCGGNVRDMLEGGKVSRPRRPRRHLQAQSFLALLIFIAGAALFIDDRQAALAYRGMWGLSLPLMLGGILYYGVLRAMMIWRN